jgi:hypothetical protein
MSMGLDPLRNVRDVGVDQYRAGLGEYLDAVASDAWANNPVMQGVRLLQAGIADETAKDRGEQLLTPAEASDRGRDMGLRFEAPIAEGAFNVIADAKRNQLANEAVFKRARLEDGYGTLHWLLGGGTEFLVSAADPLNIASAFVPVVGEARYAMWAARLGRLPAALAKGAVEGAAGQAMLEPLQALHARQMGDEYGMLDTLTNLAFGGGLGVVLHGAAYGAGAGFRFLRDRYRVVEPQEPGGRPSITVEKVDEPPPRQPIAEEMEKLRPETKETAMRTAVAQLVQDKPVDVEPVLRADPAYAGVRQAMDAAAARADVESLQARSVANLKDLLPSPVPPEGWQPAPDELKLATRVARGWDPEVPIRRPQSLVDFVRKNGGLIQGTPEASDLLAADIGRQPGLLRTREGGGRGPDDMAQAAKDNGYRLGKEMEHGSGIDTDAFMKALIEDASGRTKHFPDDAHTAAWQVQQDYFTQFDRFLTEQLGTQLKGLPAREVAWLLAQDPQTARLMTLADRIETIGPETSLEVLNLLDRERAALEREILSEEPGRLESETPAADHRDIPPVTLAELERYYANVEATAEPVEPGRRPAGEGPAGGRPAEGGEAAPAGSARVDAEAEAARLRREGGQERPAGAEQGTAGDVGPREKPGFKRWFEGSKVVNDDGTPRIVFHGTIHAFDQFDSAHLGRETGAASAQLAHFFASDPKVANSYADQNAYRDMDGVIGAFVRTLDSLTLGYYAKFNDKILMLFGRQGLSQVGSPNVRPAYVQLRNPKIVDQGGKEFREQTYFDVIRQAKAEGHDGVIFKNTFDGGFAGAEDVLTDVYAVFSEKQIRAFSERYDVPPPREPAPPAPPTPAELADFAERQQSADLHADPAALGARDERLAGEAREVQQLLADDLKDFGHLLDEDTRVLVDETGKIFDDEAKALDALASCRLGGGA